MADSRLGAPSAKFNAIDDELDDSLWNSPENSTNKAGNARSNSISKPAQVDQESRDESLRQELANVRKVNETIEGVIQSLERAKTNMKVCDLS